MSIELEEV